MYVSFAKLGPMAIVVAVLAVSEISLAGPPRSPHGGIWKPTYAGSRDRQRRASDCCARSFRHEVQAQRCRSASYESVPDVSIKAGDRVTIASAGVKLMRGREEVATLPKGQKVKIQEVQGRWLGTSIEVDEVKKSGWVLSSDVVPVAQTPKPSIEVVDADSERQPQPEVSRRNYSYRPTPKSYTARNCSPQRSTRRSHSYQGSTTIGSDDYGYPLPFEWGSRSY